MTTKPSTSPLLGYNNNVRHKGRLFHVQTEDSGPRYGHVITHLFMDGGRILKSVKTSYAEYVDNDRMGEIVREMMKQQHKAMFIALRDGKFDEAVDGGAGSSQATHHAVASGAPPPSRPPASEAPQFPPAEDTARHLSPTKALTEDDDGPPTVRQTQPHDLTLDVDELERAARANASSPMLRSASDLPPPPANLLREKGATGRYRVTPDDSSAASTDSVASCPASARASDGPPSRRSSQPSIPSSGGERRYAPTRPAAIFDQARPQQGKPILDEDLSSDKSLDDVILGYLAEDLGGDDTR